MKAKEHLLNALLGPKLDEYNRDEGGLNFYPDLDYIRREINLAITDIERLESLISDILVVQESRSICKTHAGTKINTKAEYEITSLLQKLEKIYNE